MIRWAPLPCRWGGAPRRCRRVWWMSCIRYRAELRRSQTDVCTAHARYRWASERHCYLMAWDRAHALCPRGPHPCPRESHRCLKEPHPCLRESHRCLREPHRCRTELSRWATNDTHMAHYEELEKRRRDRRARRQITTVKYAFCEGCDMNVGDKRGTADITEYGEKSSD